MPAPKIDPIEIHGTWARGFVLERNHTLKSEVLGHDAAGNPVFNTVRSELGELVFQLKNRNNRSAAEPIAEAAAEYVKSRRILVDVVVPVPASTTRSRYQPTEAVAKELSQRLGVPAFMNALRKAKTTIPLKNVFEAKERARLLEGVFEAVSDNVKGMRVLLLDDLFRSGATANAAAAVLSIAGAQSVYFLAITKTRVHR